MNIQIVSDIHTEFWGLKSKFNFVKPCAEWIHLSGDIGCCADPADFEVFKRFICELVPQYKYISYVTGNHEYYYNPVVKKPPTADNTMDAVNKRIKDFFKQTSPKLHFLNNSTMKLLINGKKYIVAGTTLWTWIPPNRRISIQKEMNDYQHIYLTPPNESMPRRITAEDITVLHIKSVNFIKNQIARAKKDNALLIIFTHHKPYASPYYDPSTLDCAYESDLGKLCSPRIILWGYGHTHVADRNKINGTQMYSNPKGYPSQKTYFKKDDVLRITTTGLQLST
jgi:predicted phosphodiesterase